MYNFTLSSSTVLLNIFLPSSHAHMYTSSLHIDFIRMSSACLSVGVETYCCVLSHDETLTFGRTPLNEWSVCRRGSCTHIIQKTEEINVHTAAGFVVFTLFVLVFLCGLYWLLPFVLYCTTHTHTHTHKKTTKISVTPARFEPATPAIEQPQAYALNRMANGIRCLIFTDWKFVNISHVHDTNNIFRKESTNKNLSCNYWDGGSLRHHSTIRLIQTWRNRAVSTPAKENLKLKTGTLYWHSH
jgi:hypothetical protein